MDIEHLSKSQIILLTLLVSFVTSIATGIVTVSLMEQAPPVVAQTVNRVIERTIQTVASSTPAKAQAAATIVTQEKTIIVNESQLISDAVKKIDPSIVRVYTASETNPVLLAIGVVIDGSGLIVTDSEALNGRAEMLVALPDSTRIRMFVTGIDRDNNFAFLEQATTTAPGAKPIVWVPAKIATSQTVLGESVVALSGKSSSRIAPGVVTSLVPAGGGIVIDTTIPADALLPGSPLVDTQGALLGVSTSASRASSLQGFIPAAVLLTPKK